MNIGDNAGMKWIYLFDVELVQIVKSGSVVSLLQCPIQKNNSLMSFDEF